MNWLSNSPSDGRQSPRLRVRQLIAPALALSTSLFTNSIAFAVPVPGRMDSSSIVSPLPLPDPPRGGSDASFTWTGNAGNPFWNSANNWSPLVVPAALDAISFPTLINAYGVNNNLINAGPTYASIALTGSSAGTPTFVGGFNAIDLMSSGTGANFTDGGYQFEGNAQASGASVLNIGSGATLSSAANDPTLFLSDSAVIHVQSGGRIDLPTEQSSIVIDDTAQLNITAGGTVSARRAFIGNDQMPGPRVLTIDGANASMRVDYYTMVHTNTYAPPANAVNITVSNGGRFSTGLMEVNENPTATGRTAHTNITVNDGTFEVANAVGFENSYFLSGAAPGPGTTTIQLASGGQFLVRDTDGVGQAFAVFSNSNRADTSITIGGKNSAGTRSTMQIDGLLFVAPSDSTSNSTLTNATITLNADGRLLVRDASVFASDHRYEATLNVNAGAIADLGEIAIFSGGSSDSTTQYGGGSTNVIITGGEVRAGSFEIAGDAAATPAIAARTTIVVNGPTARLIADGVDDPATPAFEGGVFLASRGNGTTGSDSANFAQTSIAVVGGARLEANEGFYGGDTQDGLTEISVSGTGTLFDAGGKLAINHFARPSSRVTMDIGGGALVRTSSSSTGATGHIEINAVVGAGEARVSLGGAGTTLQTGGAIHIGGQLESDGSGGFNRGIGSSSTLTSDAGTSILAQETFYLSRTSQMETAGRFEANSTFIDGNWKIHGGDAARVVRTGDLTLSEQAYVRVTPIDAATPVLVVANNFTLGEYVRMDLYRNAIRVRPGGVDPTTLADVEEYLALGESSSRQRGLYSSLLVTLAIGYDIVDVAGSFLGEPTQPGDLLIRVTLPGDTDLSGTVDFDDLLALAQNYGSASGKWYTGDFDRDGHVDFDDLLSLAQNYNATLLADGSAEQNSEADLFLTDWALARTLVPEPTSLLSLPAVACAIGRRRRQPA